MMGFSPEMRGGATRGVSMALSGIVVSFGGVAALDGVDLGVTPGELHAVIGPNGAGKSTLVNVISGLYRPDQGEIRLNGQLLRRMPTDRLAALGVVRTFQNLALFRGLSVIQNVMVGLTHRARATSLAQVLATPAARREEAAARDAARSVLEKLSLVDLEDAPVASLSYGLQKRVELARALVGSPRLLLLDEPMAGMNASEKQAMSRFIRDARDRTGATVILIEHDVGVVMALSDRITVLDHGRHIATGTPSAIRANQRVISAYLGVADDDLAPAERAVVAA